MDARITAAAADIGRHAVANIGVAGIRILLQERNRAHDLAGLAVAALDHVRIDPGELDALPDRKGVRGLDRHHLIGPDLFDRGLARKSRLAAHMDGAGAA